MEAVAERGGLGFDQKLIRLLVLSTRLVDAVRGTEPDKSISIEGTGQILLAHDPFVNNSMVRRCSAEMILIAYTVRLSEYDSC